MEFSLDKAVKMLFLGELERKHMQVCKHARSLISHFFPEGKIWMQWIVAILSIHSLKDLGVTKTKVHTVTCRVKGGGLVNSHVLDMN